MDFTISKYRGSQQDTAQIIAEFKFSSKQWRSQEGGGQPGICPPPPGPSAIRQALGRECTHQADQGENCKLTIIE